MKRHICLMIGLFIFPLIVIALFVVLPRFSSLVSVWKSCDNNILSMYKLIMNQVDTGDILALIAGILTYYGTISLAIVTIVQNDKIMDITRREAEIQEIKARNDNRPKLVLSGLHVMYGTYKDAKSWRSCPTDTYIRLDGAEPKGEDKKAGTNPNLIAKHVFPIIPDVAWGIAELKNTEEARACSIYCCSSYPLQFWMDLVRPIKRKIGSLLYYLAVGLEDEIKTLKEGKDVQPDNIQAIINKMQYENLEYKQFFFMNYGSLEKDNCVHIPFIVEQGIGVDYGSRVIYRNQYGHVFSNFLRLDMSLVGKEISLDASLSSQDDWKSHGQAMGAYGLTHCYQRVELKEKRTGE